MQSSKFIIVGLSGRKHSGKSLAAQCLRLWAVENQVEVHHIYFAKALKDGLEAMGIPGPYIHDPALKEKPLPLLGGKSGRHAMVTLGTEWGRKMMTPNLWVNLFSRNIFKLYGSWAQEGRINPVLVLVDDVRFPEEVEEIQDFRFLGVQVALIHIERPSLPRFPKWWEFWKQKPHISERFQPDGFKIPTVINDSTLTVLDKRIRVALQGQVDLT